MFSFGCFSQFCGLWEDERERLASLKRGGGSRVEGGGYQVRLSAFWGAYCFIIICACTRRALLGLVIALLATGFLVPLGSPSSIVDEQHLSPRGAGAGGLGRVAVCWSGRGCFTRHVWFLGEETH